MSHGVMSTEAAALVIGGGLAFFGYLVKPWRWLLKTPTVTGEPLETNRLPLGRTIPHMYKWSRDADTFVAKQIAFANAAPVAHESVIPHDCLFKINHEIVSETSTREDGLDLILEVKMTLIRQEIDGLEFHVLRLRPLRGTDFLPVLRKFEAALGEVEQMYVMGDAVGGDLMGGVSSLDVAAVWRLA